MMNDSNNQYELPAAQTLTNDELTVHIPGVAEQVQKQSVKESVRLGLWTSIAAVLVLIFIFLIGFVFVKSQKDTTENSGFKKVPLSQSAFSAVSADQLNLGQLGQVDINGLLRVNGGLVITPSAAPSSPLIGQLYFNKDTNQISYYDGTAFQVVANQSSTVSTVGGATGAIGLGNGLALQGNTLSATAINSAAVTSVQGQTGAVLFLAGDGVGISGTTISNTGVRSVGGASGNLNLGRGLAQSGNSLSSTVSLTSGSISLIVTDDGNGNYIISQSGIGTGGTVALGPAITQTDASNFPSIRIDKTGTGNLLHLSENGVDRFIVTQGGAISVGSIGFSQLTGVPSIVNSVTDGVTTSSGALTIGTGLGLSGNTISNTGVRTLTGTANQVSVSAATGAITLSLPQDINTNSTPSFSGLTLTALGNGIVQSSGGALSSSAADRNSGTLFTNNLSVANGGTGSNSASGARTNLGAAASGANSDITSLSGLTTALSVPQGGTGATSLGTNGVLIGNGAGAISSVVAGGTGLCLVSSAGAPTWQTCTGLGAVDSVNTFTGAITVQGTANQVNVSSSAGTITLSLPQNLNTTSSPQFSSLTLSSNLIVQGGSGTFGTATQAGGVIIYDGSNNTATFQTASLGQNTVYTLPDPGLASTTICLSSGNCAGVGGGVTTAGGTTNALAKFTGAQSIGDSNISDNGTTVSIGSALNVTGAVTLTSALTVGNGGTGATSASGARTNLGAAASGANSDITSLSGLTTALSVGQGGTGATTLGANGVIVGNGTGALSSIVAGGSGLCLMSTAGAPAWGACPGGAGGVDDVNGFTGSITIQGTVNQVSVGNSSGTLTLSLPQNIHTGSSPQFTGLTLSGLSNGLVTSSGGVLSGGAVDRNSATYFNTALSVANGGTGSNSASGARTNLGAAASGANSDITSLSGLTTALSVGQGGTGATTLGANGVLVGNGTGAISSVVAGGAGLCLTSTAGAPSWASCPGSGGVSSVNTFTGAVTVQGTANQVNVANSAGTITLSLPQNLNTTSSPQFSGLTLTGNLVVQGGTGTFGTTTVAGGVIIYDGSSNTGTLQTAALGQNTVYNLPDPGQASVNICLSTGNCAGSGGGVTTAGGTTNYLALFSGANSIANSTISQSGSTLTATGNLILQGANSLAVGLASTNAGSIAFYNSAGANTVSIQAPNANPGSNLVFRLPSSDGGSGDCLKTDSTGNLSFGTCLSGSGGGGGGVVSLDGLSGTLTISNATGSGSNITIDDATTATKGIASFSSSFFSVTSGAVSIATGVITSNEIANGTITGTDIGSATVANANLVNSSLTVTAGNGLSGGGSVSLGSSTSLAVAYGSTANTAVQGNTSLVCGSGTGNLSGGGNTITLGSGGTCGNISIVNNPTFTTSVTTAQLIMTGAGSNGTLQVANLGQATSYTLPDPGSASATICLSTGNCAGSGGGVTTAGGTNNTIAKFTGSQTLGNSTITDNGTTVAIGGALNVTGAVGLTVQLSVANGGTGATTLASNGVLLGNGTSAISSLVAGGSGLCLTSTAGAPAWASCPGSGGVSTVNTFSGAITIQGTANQISVGNSSGTITLSTPQNIHTGASPQFSGLTVSSDLAVNGSAITTTSTGTMAIFNTNAVGLNIGGAVNATGINFAGGSASTGCTIDGSNGNLTCSGNITGGATGTAGYFTRSGTTLSPATAGDNITTSGNISTTGSGTITSAGTLTASGGASISSGLNNNSGGITNTGSIAGASTIAASSTINTTGGVIQTNSLTRIDNSGNLTNIGNLTGTAAVQITSTGATNDLSLVSADQIILNSTGTIELQDNTNLTGNLDVSGTLFAGTGDAFQVASNGAVTAVGVNSGSGLLQGTGGLTVSGTISLNGNVDVNNNVSFATKVGTTFTAPGTSNNAALNGASFYLLDTSGAAQVINGITAGRDGQRVTLTNVDGANAVTISNDSVSATGARIITGTGNDVTLAIGATAELIYDSANTRWRVNGGVAGGNGTCSTCANTSLSNLSGVNINTALNRNSGDLTLQTTTSGNIVINAAGTLDIQDTIANSTGNIVLNDIVQIGSATTGLNVTTDGVITDLDDTSVAIGQSLSVTGDITLTGGNLTSTAGTLTVDGGGTVSITDDVNVTGLLFQSSNGIRVATFNNISTRVESGFYETDTATGAEGWPTGCATYCHLIASTHSNTGNYYSLQLAGDFFNQNFYLRSTNNSGAQAWSQVATLENAQTFSGTKTFSAVTTFNENVNLGAADQIDFADENTDKIYFNSNTQGIGVEANTLTSWTDSQFRWRTGATSSTSGTERMLLDASNLNLTNGTGLAVAGNTTLTGNLAVNGGQITSTSGTLTINAGGNVDIQDTLTADSLTLDAGDITVSGGDFATSAITLNKPVYIRGTGNNNPGNRLVRIGSDTHVNTGSRGLTLTIITASTHAHVGSTNYDTYSLTGDSDNLATALNNLTRDQIGILTSVDAFENSITANLRTAAFRLGLDKLGTVSTTSSLRAPYAAIFRGAGTGTNNSEAGRQAIEVLQNQDADSASAIISTWLTENGFGDGQSHLSALYSSNSQLSTPSLQVDYNGRVGVGTTSPSAFLHVSNSSGPLFVVTDTTATARDVLTIADGGAATFRNQTDSASAFVIQNAAATESLFTVDTAARSAGGGNRIKIGNSSGTDGNLTVLQLDAQAGTTLTNAAALNGGLFYDSTAHKIMIVENGSVKEVCNKSDALCGGNSTTLQQAYDNSASPALVTTSSAAKTITFRSGGGFNTAGMFNIQNASSVDVFTVDTANSRVGVGGPAANSTLTVGTNTTTASGGITFGTDTSLYRSAADILSMSSGERFNIVTTGINTAYTTSNGQIYSSVDAGSVSSNATGGTDENMNNAFEAVKFSSGSNTSIGSVTLSVKRAASISLDCRLNVRIYTDDGGAPSKPSALVATGSTTLYGYATTTSYADYQFRIAATVSATTNYWLVVEVNSCGASDLMINSTTGTNTHAFSANAITWTNENKTLVYQVMGATYTALQGYSLNAPAVNGISTNSTGVLGTSTNLYGGFFSSTNGNGAYATSTNNVALWAVSTNDAAGVFSMSGTTSQDNDSNVVLVQRTVSGTEDVTGDLLVVNEWSTTSGTNSGDLLSLRNNFVETFTVSRTGDVLSQNTTNSATAFRIQDSSSTVLLNADTTAGRISIGTNGTDTGQLYSGGRVPATTAGIATAQNAISEIAIQGKYAYAVSFDNDLLRIFDISVPTSPTNIANTGVILSGAEDIVVSGRYAYTANVTDDTLKVHDISNPNSVSTVASVSLGAGADPTALIIGGNYIYIINNASDEIEVWDISNPASPMFISSNNTQVNDQPADAYLQGRYLYVVNRGTSPVIEAFDISNPYAVTSAGSVSSTHSVTSVTVNGRYAYVGDEQATSTLKVFDVENPASMSQVGSVAVASGNGLRTLRFSGRYVYGVTTFTANRMHIFDVSSPTAPAVVGSVTLSGSEAYDLEIQGRYAYVPTYSGDTFEVYDLGGAYLQQLQAGNAEVSTLTAQELYVDNTASIAGTLNVGGDALISSDLGVGGNSYFMGDIKVGKRADSTTAIARASNATAGTITASGRTAIDTVSTSIVYNGSLYIGTYEPANAEIYRYDGNNIWTQIHTTDGNICGQTGVDIIRTMVVYNGYMYVGTGGSAGTAEICRYDGGTSWTRVSTATPGTIATSGRTAIDEVYSSAVVNGQLYFGTFEANNAEIYRYNLSTGGFTQINSTDGTICGQTSVDGVASLIDFDGQLYIGTAEGAVAEICRYDGGTTFTRVSSSTPGTITSGSYASVGGIYSMIVYNGALYASTYTVDNVEIFRYEGTSSAPADNGRWTQINSTDGNVCGQTGVDGVTAATVYNGQLYFGTATSVTAFSQTELCRYDGGNSFTRINSAAGTLVTTGIDFIYRLTVWNGQLIITTSETNAAEVYTYSAVEGQSYALRFGAASDNDGAELQSYYNEGSISFAAEQQAGASTGAGGNGSFLFSHGITTAFGAYDVAEDYPTRDEDILPGSLVSIDPNETGFVRRTQTSNDSTILGVFSEKPGLRLSQAETHINGARPIPIALAGRVPVNVTDENGPIQPGDYLTSSSTPGYAMKATQPGPTVGKALEAFSGPGTGKVLTFINISYYEPSISGVLQVNSADIGNLNVQGSVMVAGNINAIGDISIGGNLTVDGNVTVAGDLSVAGTVTVGNLVVNGHISTGGDLPTVSVLPAAGSGATISIEGNDAAGALTITTGAQQIEQGDIAKILFVKKYDREPRVVITPVGRESAVLGGYVSQTTEEFVLGASTQPEPNKTYKFNYFIVE